MMKSGVKGCQTESGQGSVAFYNTGRGGLAPHPYESLSSNNIWEDVPLSNLSTSPTTAPDKIVEAQGWIVNQKGQIVLVAQMPINHFRGRCRLR
jgi:large exoprotein involved in heme utilization and adhesion